MNIYKKNLEALGKTHPHLVQMVENTEVDENRIKISNSNTDQLQIVYRKEDGTRVAITDTSDPVDVSQFPKRVQGLLESENESIVMLLLGFGLGGYPGALLQTLGEKGVLIVYEALPELFKVVIQEKDLSGLLGSERLELFLGEQTEGFSFIRKYHRDIMTGRSYILQQSTCVDLKQSTYDKLRKDLVDEKRLADTNVVTGISRGGEWVDAFIDNVPTILRTPGVNRLRGLFKGRPAIIVSAGPSLEKNYHLLREAKGKAIIIAVDVVTPTLLSAGIIPDIIVAIESNRKLFLVFQDNPLLRLTPLVCSGEVNNATMTALYPGPIFLSLLPHQLGCQWLQRYWETKGFIPQFGSSVAHTAFALAEMVGAGPIALMGQDLSFQEKLHAGDVTGLFYADDEIERYRQRNTIVTDIFGEKRHTMHQFLAFQVAFEKHIKSLTIEVINATEGGLPIEGAKNMRLKDFIDEYCNAPPLDTFKILEALSGTSTEYDLPGLLRHISDDTSKLKKVHKSAKRIVDCFLRLKELRAKDLLQAGEAAHLVKTIEKLEKKVEDPIVRIVGPYRYKMENYFRRHEIDDDNLDVLQDSLNYYGHLIEIIDRFLIRIDDLIGSLTREQGVDNILADTSSPTIEKYFRAGTIHNNAGMVTQAVKELERVALEFSSFSDPKDQRRYWPLAIQVHSDLAELYLKQHRFYEAKEILNVLGGFSSKNENEIQKGIPDNQMVTRLLNTCYEKASEWEAKKAKAELLLNKSQANYGSHLETGSFYFKVGNPGRAEQAYLKAIAEAHSLIEGHDGDPAIVSAQTIRLLGAYYGLAQTYLVMERRQNAVSALDSGKHEIEKLDCFNLPEALEGFAALFVGLYLSVGEREKAISICQHVLAFVPNSITLKEKIRILTEKDTGQLLEARA